MLTQTSAVNDYAEKGSHLLSVKTDGLLVELAPAAMFMFKTAASNG